jgi:hypothetical protein
MDAFIALCHQDAKNPELPLVDVSADGHVFVLNGDAQLWKSDGKLLQLANTSLIAAYCYELHLSRSLRDFSLQQLRCHELLVHPLGAFVLVHGTVVCSLLALAH